MLLPDPSPIHNGYVLIVDDDPLVGDSLDVFFEAENWQVDRAATISHTRKQLEENPGRYDLILLDVRLPDGNGLDFLEEVERGTIAPVIVISTHANDAGRLRALGLGAEDFLSKPVQPEELLGLMKRLPVAPGQTEPVKPSPALKRIGAAEVDLEGGFIQGADKKKHKLSDFQRALLGVLVAHSGKAVSRKRLIREALNLESRTYLVDLTLTSMIGVLDEQIDTLREFIEPDPERPQHLRRVFGQGYRLNQ
jgi:two-component system KDP operon response regulator KdpE